MNSAAEKYQQIIRQVASDIGGVQNIADYLIVHGKSIEEHGQSPQSASEIRGKEPHLQPDEV